jgi:phosphoglycerate dehydrogenase-like enzyme
MKTINVLATIPLSESLTNQIAGVGPGIHLTSIADLMSAENGREAGAREKLDMVLADAEVIYGFRLPQNVVARSPGLKWVQMTSAGVDRSLDEDLRDSPVIMTNVRGMHAATMSEFVMGEMLMFAKGAQRCFQQKQGKQWKPFMVSTLHSKTVGIVGLGSIGREIARLAKAFGMRVLGVRRSAGKAKSGRYVDEYFPRSQLRKLLAESDFVVLILPLTSETNKIIGEDELNSMKTTAYLINVARGNVVDEQALIEALENNRIAGAGLDVFATEPLPATSRLWDMPNVIFSPHIAGGMEGYTERATDIFCENLRRYLSGQKLLKVVNKQKGY